MTTPTAVGAPSRTCTPAQRVTRSLLGYGVLAGIVFEASILIQGLTRHGFRLAHHDASLLSNGPLGWIQIATFLVSGAMTIACAVGMRRAMAGRAGGTWGPRLIAIYGAGLMAAGLLRADPAYGFGPGASAGKAVHISWHAAGHLVSASIGFTALIVACFVIARYFSRERRRGLAIYSRASGLAFLAAFAGVTTGSDSSAIVLPFYAGVLIAWIRIAVTSVHFYRRAGAELTGTGTDPAGHRHPPGYTAEIQREQEKEMRYMMLLSGTNPATPPPPELFEAIMKLGGEATQAGVMLDTAGLLPSAAGARVSLTDGKVTVTDGPFTESKELISYALYEVRSKEEAVEWASRFIKLHRDHWAGWTGSTDILQVMGPEGPAGP